MIIELCRLVRDVELKTTNFNGEDKSVLNNAIAIKVGKEQSAFIDITAWGSNAELMAKHLKKGDELLIKGEIRNKKYKVSDDKEINMPYILVSNFEFTYGNKREKESSQNDNDDIPFN